MEERKIRISDLFAFVLRRLPAMLLVAVICAGMSFVGGYMSYKNSVNDTEKLAAKDEKIEELQEELALAEKKISVEQDYMEQSVLMTLIPSNVSKTAVSIQICDIDAKELEKPYSSEENPTAVVLRKLQNRYILLFDNTNLSEKESFAELGFTSDKYIRELLSLEAGNDGVLLLTAIGDSEEDSEALAEAASSLVFSFKESVTETLCGHDILSFDCSTKSAIDDKVETAQKSHEDRLKKYEENLANLEKEIASLEKEKTATKPGLKDAVLAGVGVMIVEFVILALVCVLRNRIYSSYSGEINSEIPFLGTLSAKSAGVKGLAQRLSKERRWDSADSAKAYLLEKIKRSVPAGKRVLLICGPEKQDLRKSLELYAEELREAGLNAFAFGNPIKDSAALREITKEDCVVLAERVDISSVSSMKALVRVLDGMEILPVGFILI